MIRVLIADDSSHIVVSLSGLLAAQPDMVLVGTDGDGIEAVEKTGIVLRDVVIMDAQMPGSDGYVTKDCRPTDLFDQIRRTVSDPGTAC